MLRKSHESRDRALYHSVIKTYTAQGAVAGICLLAIGGGIYLLAHDKTIEGLSAIITPLAGVLIAFITGKVVDLFKPGTSNEDAPKAES